MPDKPDLAGKKHENMVRKEIEWENAMSHPCQCKCCKSWKAAHDQIVSLKDIQIKGASEAFTELESRDKARHELILAIKVAVDACGNPKHKLLKSILEETLKNRTETP